MNLNGCIFGWLLFQEIESPLAHHTGIIVQWNEQDIWKSIVVHYGSDCTSRVLVETLKDAVIRSEVKVVKINPHYHASFTDEVYTLGSDGSIYPTEYIREFEYEHKEYNVITSNCQHFVKRFIGNIPLESDVFNHITPICQNLIYKIAFGRQQDVNDLINKITLSYNDYRSTGICAWDESLNIDVPSFNYI